MAIDQWRWPVQLQGGGSNEYRNRVRKVQFGEGHQQITPEGIDSEYLTIPIEFIGNTATAMGVRDFLRNHVHSPFKIAPPDEQLGLYTTTIDSVRYTKISTHVGKVTATIETAYGYVSTGAA